MTTRRTDSRLTLPSISDADIEWAAELLGLSSDAFSAAPDGQARTHVLRNTSTMDVDACPGSGKTTLLVAKLALLSKSWTSRRRGICVLSHTNVARHEIEERLGTYAAGRRLRQYPHFVGTIHGFVNEFLALPLLRSKGFSVRVVDDVVVRARRWSRLKQNIRRGLESAKFGPEIMSIEATDFSVGDLPWGQKRTPLSRTSEIYQSVVTACRLSCEDGYFCHDEMFLWGEEALNAHAELAQSIRLRFPVLFIDEVQDNNERQSALLSKLFIEGQNAVLRQRFGDSNQAIFRGPQDHSDVASDPFPDPSCSIAIPMSNRFGQDIADLVAGFGCSPHAIVGQGTANGGVKSKTKGKSTIFLFSPDQIVHVLPNFAHYLTQVFSDEELALAKICAVGAVHKPPEDKHIPSSVAHYWPAYRNEISAGTRQAVSLDQFLEAARADSVTSTSSWVSVNALAEATLFAANFGVTGKVARTQPRAHRQVVESLSEHGQLLADYLAMAKFLASSRSALTADERTNVLRVVEIVATTIAGEALSVPEWERFKEQGRQPTGHSSTKIRSQNVFEYPQHSPKLRIRLGSIHSVKGETHLATLVLDTFFNKHHLKMLKPWILGDKQGGNGENQTTLHRLKLHYVAMTRPSHLLCCAMREDYFDEKELEKLKTRWRVARVADGGAQWA